MRDALPSLLFADPRLPKTQMRGGVKACEVYRQAGVSSIVDDVLLLAVAAAGSEHVRT
jgi:hypothetical protein